MVARERSGFGWKSVLLVAALLAAALALGVQLDLFGLGAQAELRSALSQRGRVAYVRGSGLDALVGAALPGTTLVEVSTAKGLAGALNGKDGQAVARALRENDLDALWLAPQLRSDAEVHRGGSIREQVERLGHVDGLRGVYISRRAALYAPDPIGELTELDRKALAGVARGLVGGARIPRLSSFPERLRRVQSVEVMVVLLEGDKARLWRSARGSSLARALVTAATVARQRWTEREQAMGAALDPLLPRLRVEVASLGDDGTLGERDSAFVDRVYFPEHGVGYEHKGAWRYFLPDATRDKGKGRASVAYRALLKDDGLSEETLERKELRLYRLFTSTLAVSEPQPKQADDVSAVRTPDEVLSPRAAPQPETPSP
jgi:hypothetical protein